MLYKLNDSANDQSVDETQSDAEEIADEEDPDAEEQVQPEEEDQLQAQEDAPAVEAVSQASGEQDVNGGDPDVSMKDATPPRSPHESAEEGEVEGNADETRQRPKVCHITIADRPMVLTRSPSPVLSSLT